MYNKLIELSYIAASNRGHSGFINDLATLTQFPLVPELAER